jgi:hypothetical protein
MMTAPQADLFTRNVAPCRMESEMQGILQVIPVAIEASTPWLKPWSSSNPHWDPENAPLPSKLHAVPGGILLGRKNRLIRRKLSLGHRRRVQQVTEEGLKGTWRVANGLATARAHTTMASHHH